MSSRPQFNPYSVITNGDMTITLISVVTIIQKLSEISYSYSWSGVSPVGTVTIQVSNDYAQNSDGTVKNAGTWNTLPLTSSTAVSGNTGVGFIDVVGTGAYAIRTVYTPTSGSGTLNAIISAKVA